MLIKFDPSERIVNKFASIAKMDIIDLCDDDVEMVESNSNINQSSAFQQNPMPFTAPFVYVKEEEYIPNKPVLKVIAIEKLTKSIKNPEQVPTAKRTSRRKSVLHPKAQDSDSIQFLDESTSTGSTSDAQSIIIGTESETIKAGEMLLNLDDMPNPNLELMRRVAFLRISIQHTLKELGLKPVKFERSSSWGNLRAQYIQNKLNKEKRTNGSN